MLIDLKLVRFGMMNTFCWQSLEALYPRYFKKRVFAFGIACVLPTRLNSDVTYYLDRANRRIHALVVDDLNAEAGVLQSVIADNLAVTEEAVYARLVVDLTERDNQAL